MSFAYPYLLWLSALLVPMAAWYVWRQLRGGAAMRVSTVDSLVTARRKTLRRYLRHLPFALVCAATALMVVALARPQSRQMDSSTTTKGIDIVLAIDVSASMYARDFKPDRIAAAKEVAANFINDRRGDRIGLVVFGGESFTQSPLTTDKATLLTLLGGIRIGMIDEESTAIGNGLATSVNRLRESDAVSKVVILLTDGVNNAGQIAPGTAADIASSLGIKVYTVGVGTHGEAPYPARDAWGNTVMMNVPVEIDEEILTDIADATGGQYFRATDTRSLQEIYDRINEMEKSEIETNEFTRYTELYGRFVLWALVLLAAEFLLRALWLRQIP
ncbi:MAG: VWA domain-containing protein [Alistipes sp.]|jgi:Ca-activated chloride channel family protein|nr:VWA domain-containing protein [Alistipes sp.]